MDIIHQVISLEIAKKLKELGVEQESLWLLVVQQTDQVDVVKTSTIWNDYFTGGYIKDMCSAYTASELCEMLPSKITYRNITYSLLIQQTNEKSWHIDYYEFSEQYPDCISDSMPDRPELSKSLANALGKMLIYLIENKLAPKHKEKP